MKIVMELGAFEIAISEEGEATLIVDNTLKRIELPMQDQDFSKLILALKMAQSALGNEYLYGS